MQQGAEMAGADTVLIIEDDDEIADIVAVHLRDLGLHTERAANGKAGLEKALAGDHALIVLDLSLPRLDGMEICRRIRESRSTPILMLTARSEEIDRVLGLEIGADDYVTKPFSVRELTARVKALLRRSRGSLGADPAAGQTSPVEIGVLSLDPVRRKVTVSGKAVELTAKEFDLLALFMRNPGRAYGRSDLLGLVWGYQYEGYEHTVNSHINRLRAKIEPDPGHPRYLRTVWGIGYKFAEPAELGEPAS
jgi:DNA-binding response OmpR family regulator